MTIPYRFMPWSRRGLARAHANPDAAGAPLATRPRVNVGLTLHAQRDGSGTTAVSGNINLTLYGPADVIGIDQRLVVRTEPLPNVTTFEPNYLAAVDFDPPDFPWLLTPAHASASGHLRPWLVLVVIERKNGLLPTLRGGRPLPSIVLSTAQVKSELPNLAESHLWAHTQAVSEVDTQDQKAAAGLLSSELLGSPARNISRLVCPRKLEPETAYLACVVPATDGGCRRGLNQPVQGDTLTAAWPQPNQTELELPVYYYWTFSTGPVGDIETLARRLRTPRQYAVGPSAQTILDQLRNIGQRPTYVDGDGLLFKDGVLGQTLFEGAMVPLKFNPKPWNENPASELASKRLADILDSGSDRVATGTIPGKGEPVPSLAPPIYGEFPAKRHTVFTGNIGTRWLDDLSLQPRYRLVAGWGAEIVRQNQDEFMQAAWAQLGDVIAAERAFSLARLARDVLKRIETRHLAKLSPERMLAVMSPARARIALAAGQSLYGRMANATLPQELFDGSMRRLASPRRATFKMAHWRERSLGLPSVTVQMRTLVDNFANASARLDVIDPNRFVPDGILGSRSFDKVPLPADLDAQVDLMPYFGLAQSMTGHELKAVQAANTAARTLAATTKRKAPLMGDVFHRGLLTETHAIRIAELQSFSPTPIPGNVGQLIQMSSTRGTEGVLLSVHEGSVSSQALRIDGRSGTLQAVRSPLVATGDGAVRASKTARGLGTAVAKVPLSALKQYGNTAVFATLPPSTLGRGGAELTIGLSGPGSFGNVPPVEKDAVPTITLPPAVKDRATLDRYSAAFKDYRSVVFPAADSLAIVKAVDFGVAANATQTRARTDANRTVPARLASTLSLGDQAVDFKGGALSNAFISASLDAALADVLRYVVPPTFDRVMAFPRLPFPLSRKLELVAPEVFVPGVGVLPDDFIMAVQTNPRFVEALMVGANHEMCREMLWQGLPTDQRGTPFQHFWQRLDGKTDVEFIHQWHAAAPLGKQPGSTAMTVLLFRGQLLERFPNLNIYAYKIEDPQQKRPGGPFPAQPDNKREMDPDLASKTVLRGNLGRDITYVGFDIKPAEIGDYFFIVEEHMTEPRFGFDDPGDDGQDPNSWQGINWSDVGVEDGKFLQLASLKNAPPAKLPKVLARWVDPHAATVADAILQRPFRGFWKGDALKTPDN